MLLARFMPCIMADRKKAAVAAMRMRIMALIMVVTSFDCSVGKDSARRIQNVKFT